jgi:YidC/Oxa1 family membrane protein insertase
METFNTIFVYPIVNALLAIYQSLDAFGLPYALGFSIIVLTILIRFLLYPLTAQQLRASKKMQDLAPHLSKVKDLHKGDNKRIQQETMKIYKEHGVNPAAGCLPTLLQLPIIFGLYNALDQAVKKNEQDLLSFINDVAYHPSLRLSEGWDTSFFGIPLASSPSQLMSSMILVALAVPVLTGIFQYLQSKMLFPSLSPADKAKRKDDFATAFQQQSTYIFPIMIAFFSFTFPVGLSLYWNTFTIFGIIQQYKISGPGGLVEVWQKIKRK